MESGKGHPTTAKNEPNARLGLLKDVEEAQTLSNDQSVSAPNLLRAAMEGDGEAFGLLVDPCIPAALAGAELILGSQADASDAVQDALLSAWRGLRGLREPDKFSAWFRTLVVRSALKLAGRRTRSRRRGGEQRGMRQGGAIGA